MFGGSTRPFTPPAHFHMQSTRLRCQICRINLALYKTGSKRNCGAGRETDRKRVHPLSGRKNNAVVMNLLDLIKATFGCGISAFLIYSFPVISQVVIIGLLSLLWLSYAHRTVATIRRK